MASHCMVNAKIAKQQYAADNTSAKTRPSITMINRGLALYIRLY